MPRLPRLTAQEAEKLLLDSGFLLLRIKGSHHIYFRDGLRVVVPFHSGKILHPKIIKLVIAAITPDEEDDSEETLE
ncbi:type II toxin-antitoxin system HicA family toxin [Phormidesmis sp. 146-35]